MHIYPYKQLNLLLNSRGNNEGNMGKQKGGGGVGGLF